MLVATRCPGCGAVFDLATLWRLAAHWYDGRLDRGYTRRESAQASADFADVGLRGPFWGLPAYRGGEADGRWVHTSCEDPT